MSLQSQAPHFEIYEFKRLYLITYIFKEVPGPALNLQKLHAIRSRMVGKLPLEKDVGVLARCIILSDLKPYSCRLISFYVIVIIPQNKKNKKKI